MESRNTPRKDPTNKKALIGTGKDGKPYVDDPDSLYQEMVELREEALEERRKYESLWRMCWRYFKGDQWHRLSSEWKIEKIDVGRKPKLVFNKILPVVQTRKAHVLKNRPIGVVMPNTPDEEDRNAARIAQEVLEYDQYNLKTWEHLDTTISLWMFVTGNCFEKTYYDHSKGKMKDRNKYKIDPESGIPILVPTTIPNPAYVPPIGGLPGEEAMAPEVPPEIPNPDPMAGKPIIESTYSEPEGDVVVDIVLPQEFLPEPGARTLEDCQRVGHRTLKPLKWVKDTFKEAAEKVEALDTRSEYGAGVLAGAKDFGFSEKQVKGMVEVFEMWCRPSVKYPEGLHVVWADDILMAAGPTPEGHDHIPFTHYQEIQTDEFWGTSTVAQLLDPQRALNINISRDEYMRQRLRPRLVVAHEAGLTEEEWSNDDAEIARVTHPFYPRYVDPPAYNRDTEAVETYDAAIDDIGGSADIMRGQVDSDVRSGRMVSYLQEYAGTVLHDPAHSIERGVQRTGNLILRLRKHYTSEERFYYILGRNKHTQVKAFIGSDIEGAADYVVQAGSAIPMSLAEKRDMIFNMVERQILMPDDPRIPSMLGMPSDVDSMFHEDQIDRDNATEEDHSFLAMTDDPEKRASTHYAIESANQEMQGSVLQQAGTGMAPDAQMLMAQSMETGIAPNLDEILYQLGLNARDFENHTVHIETHNRTRKGRAYKMLPKWAQALFDQHVNQHKQYEALTMMAATDPASAMSAAAGEEPAALTGGPQSLEPGGGAVGSGGAGESGSEKAERLPPVPPPPGAGNHHLT